eukprot:713873_1
MNQNQNKLGQVSTSAIVISPDANLDTEVQCIPIGVMLDKTTPIAEGPRSLMNQNQNKLGQVSTSAIVISPDANLDTEVQCIPIGVMLDKTTPIAEGPRSLMNQNQNKRLYKRRRRGLFRNEQFNKRRLDMEERDLPPSMMIKNEEPEQSEPIGRGISSSNIGGTDGGSAIQSGASVHVPTSFQNGLQNAGTKLVQYFAKRFKKEA